MRVIVVTDYAFVNGGAGKVALESAEALAKRGVDVRVFAAVGAATQQTKGVDHLEIVSLGQKKVTELPMQKAIFAGLWNEPAEKRFEEFLGTCDPAQTVIHIHSWRDALTASVFSAAQRLGFKVVTTAHDFGLACPLAGFFDERNGTICQERGLSGGCWTKSCTAGSYLKKTWFVARHSVQVNRAKFPSALKHLITVSNFSSEILEPYLPAGIKVYPVRNPIPVDRSEMANPAKNSRFLFVGRFSPEKAPVLAAKAAYELGAPIAFVGSGRIGSEIREANPDVELLGWRTPEEVTNIMRDSRALIFPSIWYETQGMVVDEAAAIGLPVIVSDCTAAMETVGRLKHGSVFKANNLEALKRRMKEMQFDDVAKRFGENGYTNFWAEPPTLDAHVDRLLEVYSEVLAD